MCHADIRHPDHVRCDWRFLRNFRSCGGCADRRSGDVDGDCIGLCVRVYGIAVRATGFEEEDMIITTTNNIEGQKILEYKGIVVGEAIMGANVVRDVFASITDIVGGRSGAYEAKLQDARDVAMRELEQRAIAMGGNAVVGVDLDYEVVGNSMLMVSASGTAVLTDRG
jgi:uncharacterized protein YbjQ (UPF0145 family)